MHVFSPKLIFLAAAAAVTAVNAQDTTEASAASVSASETVSATEWASASAGASASASDWSLNATVSVFWGFLSSFLSFFCLS